MKEVVIASACRTAIGNFGGTLAPLTAAEMGAVVIEEAIKRAGISPVLVEEVIMGNVLQAGQGQNPARQMSMKAGLSEQIPSWTMNKVCGSGLKTVAMAAQAIVAGDAQCIVAGGSESMSNAPYGIEKARWGLRMGPGKLMDIMINDGLWDAFNNYHMGITAENLAERYSITREEQDAFSLASQNKAEKAQTSGFFKDEITPVTIKGRKGDIVFEADEFIRKGCTADVLAKMKPAFKKDGTVTAANASGINDGAAACVIMDAELAAKQNVKPLARIVAYGSGGVDPSIMGIGPVPAVKNALKKAGWTLDQVDLIEANEAFAAQSLAVDRELKFDHSKLNISGGAIALGHPIGSSGTRVLVTLLYGMKRTGAKRGLTTLCIGGGQGIAMLVEAL